jgi:phosphopantetheinyl transferase (holo-ACP synthase)
VNWHNVWVENERSGKPTLKFSRPLAALLKRRGIKNVYVSLTDEIGMACAFVLIEGVAPKARRKG